MMTTRGDVCGLSERARRTVVSLSTLGLLCMPVAGRAAPVGQVLGSIPAPGPCTTGLTWDGKWLWAADHKTDLLYRLDPATGRVLQQIPAPGYRPAGLAWDGTRLWNVDPLQNKLYRIDVGRAVVDHTVDSPVAKADTLAWDGEHLWLAASRSRRLHRIDRGDGTTLDRQRTPSKSTAGMVHDGRYLWLADRLADRLHVVDPPTGEVLFSVEAPGPHVTGLAFDGKQLWVADYQRDRIYRVAHRGGARSAVRREARRRQAVEFTHQLRNLGPGRLVSAEIHVAIPGDDQSQKLHGPVEFHPGPTSTVVDQWGQPVARFVFRDLPAGRFATVTMRARATLHDVQHRVFPHRIKSLSAVPAALRRRYLADGDKYLINDPVIRKAVKDALSQPGNDPGVDRARRRNPYWIARRIYRHIHQKLHYELAGGWNVAPRVLTRGSGSCSEYSFVFIAMCRAAGIPARYVGSLVVRKDDASFDDVFHRWVEIYLPGHGWLPVDPSRGDRQSEVRRADAFGHLEPDFLVTTRGGGDSRLLRWRYNSDERWVCQGRCEVAVETIAEWTPLGK